MCIAVFLWESHPRYSFLLLLNRDEFHSRDTTRLTWWDAGDGCQVLGGKDNVRGGTWLACNRQGKIAFITNLRQYPSDLLPSSKSRGFLPLRFLQCDLTPRQYAEEVVAGAAEYEGFNLVLVDTLSSSMVYVTNGGKSKIPAVSDVLPGLHVLSNSSWDSPWPKALRLGDAAKEYLETHKSEELCLEDMAQALMNDTTKDDYSMLPGILAPEWEHLASSVFVEMDTPLGRYGTRSTSGVSMARNGFFTFYERHLHLGNWKHHTETYQVSI